MNKEEKGKIISKVRIIHKDNGFLIGIIDQYTQNWLAVTKEELEKIVLYGRAILTPQ